MILRKLTAEEKRTLRRLRAIEAGEGLCCIIEIIRDWVEQWRELTAKIGHCDLKHRVKTLCVIEDGIVYLSLPNLEEEMAFRGYRVTRRELIKLLKRLGARGTEPRRRFSGTRLRTHEMSMRTLQRHIARTFI